MEKRTNYDLNIIINRVRRIEERIINNIVIIRVRYLYRVSKSKLKLGLLQNLLFQAMINIIVYLLMLNDIIPSLYDESNMKALVLFYSLLLLIISFYSIIMFESKKDLQNQFWLALLISVNTYLISYLLGLNIF